MKVTRIHQALYGYSDGHQLLAASESIDTRATRELRAYTDMAFDGRGEHYLTCLPVASMRKQAIVRTWPAPEARRPGSVWSHVLLIDFVDLGELETLSGLLQLFRRPTVDDDSFDLGPYREPIAVSQMPSQVATEAADLAGMDSLILWAVYGDDPSRILPVEDPAALETTLVRIWEQQWPRLRRSFRFRTRYRVSAQHADAFDIQIVERLERDQTSVESPDPVPSWVVRLRRDLGTPDSALRRFLRQYGAESESARTAIGPLVTVQEMLGTADRGAVPACVWQAFPEPDQMRSLKRSLFGPQDGSTNLWDTPEHERLAFVLLAEPATAVNLTDLEVRKRLDALWRERPDDAVQVVEATYRDGSRPADKLVAASTIKHAAGPQVAILAEHQSQLAAAAIHKRTDLLAAPELWTAATYARQLVADNFSEADAKVREEALLALVHADAWDAARSVVELQPSLWWVAFDIAAKRVDAAPGELKDWAERLEQLLVVAGLASIGSMPTKLKGHGVMQLLAVTFPPQAGLWRQAPSQQWVEAADSLAGIKEDRLRLRALVILVLATRLVSASSARRRLWLVAFPALHAGLAGKKFAASDWDALSRSLPPGEDEDRRDRLRRGVAAVAGRDKWAPEDAQAIVAGAHPFEDEMIAALKASRKKKSKGWLRELLDHLAP